MPMGKVNPITPRPANTNAENVPINRLAGRASRSGNSLNIVKKMMAIATLSSSAKGKVVWTQTNQEGIPVKEQATVIRAYLP